MTFIKTYRLSLLAVVVILFLNSCKKDKQTDPVLQLKGTYKSDAYFNLDDIQMFTVNGQVQDAAALNDFIKRRELDFTSGKTEALNSEMGAINFTGDGAATIDLPNNNGTLTPTKFTLTDKTTSGFILKQNDILKNAYGKSDTHIGQLFDIANLIDETANCQQTPTGLTLCDYVHKLPFTFSGTALNLSYYSLAVYNQQPGLSQLAFIIDEPGIFNKIITTKLVAGDTLVVQTKYLQFSKK